jgi:hypothetical protein
MQSCNKRSGRIPAFGSIFAVVAAVVILGVSARPTLGGDHWWHGLFHDCFGKCDIPPGQINTMNGGEWMWLRSPEQERVVVMSLYNRYCIRCHGVDGRGVWDIPGIPDFTNVRWQSCRTDAQIARIIIEGRGAVMPQFRGALSLEEAWGIAHYLRTFVPGNEVSKPDFRGPATPAATPSGGTVVPMPATPSPGPAPAIPQPAPPRGAATPFRS